MEKSVRTHLRSATVSTSYYVAAYKFAKKLSSDKFQNDHWLQKFKLETKEDRVSAGEYQQLLESAASNLNEPCFGLKYGQQIDIASFNLLGYLAMASATLKEASKAVNQFGGLVSDIGQLESEVITSSHKNKTTRFVKIYWRPKVGNESYSTQIIDAILAGWVNFGWQFIGEKAQIQNVNLTERYANKSIYEDYFNCPVTLGSNENSICIDQYYFEKNLCQAEPLVHEIIKQRANQAIVEIENTTRLASDDIKKILPELILSHQADIEFIANIFNTSPRSLQRKLANENNHFTSLLDQARHSLAVNLLSESDYSLSHIGGMIGFNDQSSFTRAFKRWQGITPKQFQSSLSHESTKN